MSPPWAVTSSLFCVVWACAAPGSACGSAPATPSAAAPLSSSRRVTSMGMHLLDGFEYRLLYPRRLGATLIEAPPGPVKVLHRGSRLTCPARPDRRCPGCY